MVARNWCICCWTLWCLEQSLSTSSLPILSNHEIPKVCHCISYNHCSWCQQESKRPAANTFNNRGKFATSNCASMIMLNSTTYALVYWANRWSCNSITRCSCWKLNTRWSNFELRIQSTGFSQCVDPELISHVDINACLNIPTFYRVLYIKRATGTLNP